MACDFNNSALETTLTLDLLKTEVSCWGLTYEFHATVLAVEYRCRLWTIGTNIASLAVHTFLGWNQNSTTLHAYRLWVDRLEFAFKLALNLARQYLQICLTQLLELLVDLLHS